jgi:hypothetical protein
VVELEMGSPYLTNITWYNNGNPIAGEDSNIIHITQDGYYYASGAPLICPNFVQTLGVSIPIFFFPPYEPDWQDYHSQGAYWGFFDCLNCETCTFYYEDTLSFGAAPVDTGTNFQGLSIGELTNLQWGMVYRVVCYDSLGCIGIDTVAFDIESIEENPLLQLNLYPNPATDILQLSLQDDIENYQVRFMDMYGRIVKQQRLKQTIDVSTLSAGVYTVEVFSKKYYLRKRMIKV